jgi:hypothetical protein
VGGWGYALGVLHGGEEEAEPGAPQRPQYLLPSQWPVGASIFAVIWLGDGILRGSIRHTGAPPVHAHVRVPLTKHRTLGSLRATVRFPHRMDN